MMNDDETAIPPIVGRWLEDRPRLDRIPDMRISLQDDNHAMLVHLLTCLLVRHGRDCQIELPCAPRLTGCWPGSSGHTTPDTQAIYSSSVVARDTEVTTPQRYVFRRKMLPSGLSRVCGEGLGKLRGICRSASRRPTCCLQDSHTKAQQTLNVERCRREGRRGVRC